MEKCFLCLPRANDYLTNITIVTWLFLIFFQIANETLVHFQDEMLLLVLSETESKSHFFFFYSENSPFLVTEVAAHAFLFLWQAIKRINLLWKYSVWELKKSFGASAPTFLYPSWLHVSHSVFLWATKYELLCFGRVLKNSERLFFNLILLGQHRGWHTEMDRSTEEPSPCNSFNYLTATILPRVRYGASSRSRLSSSAAALGLTTVLAEQPATARGCRWLDRSHRTTAQLWEHMLGVQRREGTRCCPCTLWAASGLLGGERGDGQVQRARERRGPKPRVNGNSSGKRNMYKKGKEEKGMS